MKAFDFKTVDRFEPKRLLFAEQSCRLPGELEHTLLYAFPRSTLSCFLKHKALHVNPHLWLFHGLA